MPRRRARNRPTLETLAGFRRRRFWWRVASLLVVLAILGLLDRRGVLLARGGDVGRYDGSTFLVQRVVDGDTLDVLVPDGDAPTTRIRVWGIDTPEGQRHDRDSGETRPAEPLADEATGLVTQLLAGQTVTLHIEPHRVRGDYGRVLAHVELPDGGLLAERLLLAGLAEADERWPHRHLERFGLLERQARRDGVGLWALPQHAAHPWSVTAPAEESDERTTPAD